MRLSLEFALQSGHTVFSGFLFSIVVTSSIYVGNFDHKNNLPLSFEQVFLGFTESSKPNKFVN